MGNLSVTMFHSGHFPHLLKLSDQLYRRQKTLTAGDFSGEILFRHRPYHQVRKEEIFKFCQSTEGRISVMRQPHAFLLRRPEPHSPAHEGAWSTFWQRASTSGLAWRRLTTLHLCLCHSSPASAFFWGFFVSVSPLNSLSGDLRWLPLHLEPCSSATFVFLYYLVSHSHGSSVFLLSTAIWSRIRALFDSNIFRFPDN